MSADKFFAGLNAIGAIAKRLFVGGTAPSTEGGPCEQCDDTGYVACRCGGDICICDNHGEMKCPRGCADDDIAKESEG